MNKEIVINGACYTLIAAATPWAQFLGSTQDLTPRMLAATAVASIVAGATALKAFLSTSVAFSQTSAPKTLSPIPATAVAVAIFGFSLLYLTGCGTTGTPQTLKAPTQVQVLQTADDIVNTAATAYTAYAAAQSGTLTPEETSAALTAASNDMYGAAALASAYTGTATPIAANLQTGAANVSTAAKIINALPNMTITSTTVANLNTAAATLAVQANGAPGPRGASAPPVRLDRYPNRAPDSWYNFLPPMAHELTFTADPNVITIRP